METSDRQITDGVRDLGVLLENLWLTRAALAGIEDVVITVGGECGVDLAPLAAERDNPAEAEIIRGLGAALADR